MALTEDWKELLKRPPRGATRPDGGYPFEPMVVSPSSEVRIFDADIDIPLDRMAREFRKRAGRAFGLGNDKEAEEARTLCKAIEDFDKKFTVRR